MKSELRPVPLRVLALSIELLPLTIFLMLSDSGTGAGLSILLTLVTGVGWLMLGRWDVGVAFGLARGILLVFALLLASPFLFALGSCDDCNRLPFNILASFLAALYILTTLASAAMLAWHAWHVPSRINRATR